MISRTVLNIMVKRFAALIDDKDASVLETVPEQVATYILLYDGLNK